MVWAMMRRTVAGAAALGLLATAACSAGGWGGGEDRGTVSFSVGEARGGHVFEPDQGVAYRVVVERYGYNAERFRGAPNPLLRTEWRERSPFEDEEEQGAVRARTRFIVSGRPSERDHQAGDHLYRVTVQAENEVDLEDEPDWSALTTEDFRAYARDVADELSSYLDMRR